MSRHESTYAHTTVQTGLAELVLAHVRELGESVGGVVIELVQPLEALHAVEEVEEAPLIFKGTLLVWLAEGLNVRIELKQKEE